MPPPPPYSLEFRREAVRLLRTSGRSVPQLAKELGCSPQSLRNWARQLDVDEGKAEGLSYQNKPKRPTAASSPTGRPADRPTRTPGLEFQPCSSFTPTDSPARHHDRGGRHAAGSAAELPAAPVTGRLAGLSRQPRLEAAARRISSKSCPATPHPPLR